MTNPMRNIRIEKLTLNVGAGANQDKLEKGLRLIEKLSGSKAVKTITHERIPGWSIRPGLPIGTMVTLRKAKATDMLKRLLAARDSKLEKRFFDDKGNALPVITVFDRFGRK